MILWMTKSGSDVIKVLIGGKNGCRTDVGNVTTNSFNKFPFILTFKGHDQLHKGTKG